MTFDQFQARPWPLRRRIGFGVGLVFALPTPKMPIRGWLFSPCGSLVKIGDPILHHTTVPAEMGPFFGDDSRPMKAKFWALHAAIRILGFDVGIEIWYRIRSAHA